MAFDERFAMGLIASSGKGGTAVLTAATSARASKTSPRPAAITGWPATT